jgi:DNA-binding NarL/FixJ family response regulator
MGHLGSVYGQPLGDSIEGRNGPQAVCEVTFCPVFRPTFQAQSPNQCPTAEAVGGSRKIVQGPVYCGDYRCDVMAETERTLSWWDREIDSAGRPIRSDVRVAAHEIWEEACRRTRVVLSDNGHAAELMECCVAEVSHYLDRQAAPLGSRQMNALLMLAFSRALQRRAVKFNHFESVGGTSELSNHAVDESWSRQVHARLDLDRIVRQLSERCSTILALRWAGYDWKEIAQLLGTSVAKVRSGFWREINQARRRFQAAEPAHQKHS